MRMGTGAGRRAAAAGARRRADPLHPGDGEAHPGAPSTSTATRSGSSAARGRKQPDALDFCKKYLSFGAGPRASLSLITAAKAHALIHGQVYVSCANVAAVAPSVMRHRIAVNFMRAERGHHRRRHRADDPGESPADRAAGLSARPDLAQPFMADAAAALLSRPGRDLARRDRWAFSRARSWRATASANTARPSAASPSSSPSTANTPSGDDPRHLDWKVLGRTDRYYIKQYEQDTNLVAQLLLDGSESMNYGSGKITKLHYAKCARRLPRLPDPAPARRGGLAPLRHGDARIPAAHRQPRENPPHHGPPRGLQGDEKTNLGTAMARHRAHRQGAGDHHRASAISSTTRRASSGACSSSASAAMRSSSSTCSIPTRSSFRSTAVEFIGLEGADAGDETRRHIRKSYLEEMNAMRARMQLACERTGSHYVLANTAHAARGNAQRLSRLPRNKVCAR